MASIAADSSNRDSSVKRIVRLRQFAVTTGVIAAALAVIAGSAMAQQTASQPPKKKFQVVQRSAAGTVIQPTRTIIHNSDGSTTVIVVNRRSYLDPGTEVPVGYGSRRDYILPPGGDPGRPDWFYGPDSTGIGASPLARSFWLPGFNPNY
jgi:hypothetical protein